MGQNRIKTLQGKADLLKKCRFTKPRRKRNETLTARPDLSVVYLQRLVSKSGV